MDLERLTEILKNEKPYRIKQAEEAIFSARYNSWDKATSLPKEIRSMLEKELPMDFDFKTIASIDKSTLKAALRLEDGLFVEAVLLLHRGGRNTVCVSSQAGCPMGCIFCVTARAGFKRNLSYHEIIKQVLFFKYYLKKSKESVTNVVFMGMGEPFLNYKNFIKAVRVLNDAHKFGIGARKISVSTCGIPHAIKKLARENIQLNLAVSLNAADNDLRSRIMPVNKKYPVEMLLESVRQYIHTTKRRVMFEYVLINDLNDSEAAALKLASALKELLCFVNLIPCNGPGLLKTPQNEKIRRFIHILESGGIAVTQRYRYGSDINAACGQLAGKQLSKE